MKTTESMTRGNGSPEDPEPIASACDELDIAFYTTFYEDLSERSTTEAAIHWQSFGRIERRHPSLQHYIATMKQRRSLPQDFDVFFYRTNNPDLVRVYRHDWEFVQHYIQLGAADGRHYLPRFCDPDVVAGLYGLDVPLAAGGEENSGELCRLVARLREETGEARIYLSRADLFLGNRITNGALILGFDPEFYYCVHPEYRAEIGTPERFHCLRHFCEQGVQFGLPISHELRFDPKFYVEQYGALPVAFADRSLVEKNASNGGASAIGRALRSTEELYRHWINVGSLQNFAPNRREWIKDKVGFRIDIDDPAMFDLDVYRELNPDLSGMRTDHELLAHMIAHGFREGRRGINLRQATIPIFSKVADNAAIAGQARMAAVLYDRLLQSSKRSPSAVRHAADNLFREGFFFAAGELYREDVSGRDASPWSFLNLSTCYSKLGDHRSAALALAHAARHFAQDFQMGRRAADAIQAYFDHEWTLGLAYGHVGRIAEGQSRIGTVLQDITIEPDSCAPRREVKRVALFANEDLPQCTIYRVLQKVEHLTVAGYECERFNFSRDADTFLSRLGDFDAVIFFRVPAFPKVVRAILAARAYGLATFYEIDDLIFDADEYPPPYASYDGQISQREYGGLALGVPLFRHAMSLCDYGIASTPALVESMAKIVRTGKVFLLRNAIGSEHREPISIRMPDGPVTIFYGSATKAHKEDFRQLVLPAMRELAARFGSGVRFVIVGHISMTDELSQLRDNLVLLEPLTDFRAYLSLMYSIADINIAVLHRSQVTDCKSEIKWMEAALGGIPSVLSRTQTYEEVVEDGVTGYLCDSVEEFVDRLDRLVRDPGLRERIGHAARDVVRERYSPTVMAGALQAMFSDVSPPAPVRSRLKILVVNVFYPPQAHGGATRVVHDNVSDLIARYGDQFEFEVFCSIVSTSEPYVTHFYSADGVRITGVTTPNEPDIDRKMQDERMGDLFQAHLERFKPDMVHFHCIQRLTLSIVDHAREMGIPYIVTVHDGWWISKYQFLLDDNDDISYFDFRRLSDRLSGIGDGTAEPADARPLAAFSRLWGAQAVLAVSERFAEIYRRAGLTNVLAVPNGVSHLPDKRRIPPPDHRVRLGQIGGMARHKGFHLIKYALMASQFENLSLTVVDLSHGRDYRSYETWGTTPVIFVGKFEQSETADLYGMIDVLLAPSVWPESFGLVTREALACGCWVVASNRGAVGEPVVEDLNGHIVDVSDIDGLTAVFRQIDTNAEKYRKPPEYFTPLRRSSDQADDLAAIYVQIAREKGSSST